jgi:DNA-binding MarR family transcriptional regulator
MQLEKEIHQVRPFRNDYHKATVNLIYSGKWVLQFVTDFLKPYKLTLQQYNILRILRGKYPEAITVTFIRDRMLDRMSDASRLVEHLRKKELVIRTTAGSDRRRMDVVITEKGLALLEEIEKENDQMDKRLATLDEQEVVQLNFLLDKLRNILP